MSNIEQAIIAAGDFWYLQKKPHELPGIITTVTGYCGGTTNNPSYHQLGDHSCVVCVDYSPRTLAYEEILKVVKNNVAKNKVKKITIFYVNDQQAAMARQFSSQIKQESPSNTVTIVTIMPASRFYPAENYHQHALKKLQGGI